MSETPPPPDPPLLCVVHVGEDYAVVDKPAHQFSVPGRGPDKQDSIATRARVVFPDADGPITVHRLDHDTSGLLVLGLTRDAHRTLSRQFMQRKTGKTYAAILEGLVDQDEGAIDLPLMVDWPNRPRQKIDHDEGRPARTLYRVLERKDGRTRVQFRPMTGRTHQLRVHAAVPREEGGLGCPIVGDSLYGDPSGADRLMLHAEMLAFWAPATGAWARFESPAPF